MHGAKLSREAIIAVVATGDCTWVMWHLYSVPHPRRAVCLVGAG
jgi:hypothetical protein